MRSNQIAVLAVLVFSSCLIWASPANNSPFRITSSTEQIVLELSSPEPQITVESLNGESFSRISMAGAEPSAEDGYPELPIYSGLVAIPPNALYRVSYEYSELRQIQAIRPIPVVADLAISSSLSEVYRGSSISPAEPVSHSGDAYLRDFRVLALQVLPLSWDPAANALRHYGAIRITIHLSYPEADPVPRAYSNYSYAFRSLYEAQILNFGDYRNLEIVPQDARILIIHGETSEQVFHSKLDEFVAWKRQKGFEVSVASTAVAGISNVDIKDYIQSRYDNPVTRPDFIILVGDVVGNFAVPTWFETESGYHGEGDYPYTYLSGDDMLGDAFIGRISAENVSQLGTLFSKIYAYEKNVDITPGAAAWLDRMLIIGDPTQSGISCAYVSHFIHEIAEEAHPGYTFIENYTQGFASTISTGLNMGVGFFTYRGCYGTSGWSPTVALYNGNKLPHSVILTCDTGSFAGLGLSEQFIRMGTEASPSGAVSCIGIATVWTHTAFNNALIAGIMGGVFTYGMRTMGEALLNGRLYLHSLYSGTQPHYVRSFAHWCNLMGDPSLEAWVGIPGVLNLTAPEELPLSTNSFEIVVRDSSDNPVEGVMVTAYCPDEELVVAKAFTNANGIAHMVVSGAVISELLITASKHDFKPVQQVIQVSTTGAAVYASHLVIDDGSSGSIGNSDGFANATETIALVVEIANSTAEQLSGVSAVLSTDNPKLQITLASASYPTMPSGHTATGTQAFLVSLNSAIDPHEKLRFVLSISVAGGELHESVFYVDAYNAALSVYNFSVDEGGNGILDPDETAVLNLQIANSSLYPATGLRGELSSLNPLLIVTQGLSWFGDLMPSSQVGSVDGFMIQGRESLIPGMQMPMRLRLYNDSGFEQFCIFNLPVGSVSQNTPLGPDEYGYLIYDHTDTGFEDCPVYDWVEIVPSLGGAGSIVPDLYDNGFGNTEGETGNARALKTLELPFIFPFYGINYDKITVCVNGFIALGVTKNAEFRNARLPGGQGPAPMIAAFWDDLFFRGTSGVYHYYDAANHRYILQYHEMTNGFDDISLEEFQVIFYDPIYHPTGLGDGKIKIQYKTFNNVDVGTSGLPPMQGLYSTIGIKDHTNLRGLEYSFNNNYAAAAAPLGDETAILITTTPAYHEAAHLRISDLILCDLNSDALLQPGESAEIGIELDNIGVASAGNISMRIQSLSEYATLQNDQSNYPDIPGGATAVNYLPFGISIAEDCPDGTRVTLICEVSSDGDTRSIPVSMLVHKPRMEMERIYLNDPEANNNGILEPGETVSLVVNLKNPSAVTVNDVRCSLTSSSELVTLLERSYFQSSIPPHSTVQSAFRFSLSDTAPLGGNVYFNISYSAEEIASQSIQLPLRIGTTGFTYDFEAGSGAFFANPNSGAWEWGSSGAVEAHSGSKLWGTLLNDVYPNDSVFTLRSPSTYLGTSVYLEFWHYYDMEQAQDGGNVKISVGSGDWTVLTPVGGYPYSNVAASGEPGFSGNSDWSLVQFDLSAYAGQNVRFRWDFASDAQNQGQGWFIDDLYTMTYGNYVGLLSGEVLLGDTQTRAAQVLVRSLDGSTARTDSTGVYRLYLPKGTHTVQASAPGYETATISDIVFNPGTSSLTRDFSLIEFKSISSFNPSHTLDAIRLSWKPPQNPHYPVIDYKVMRKINAGAFEIALVTADTSYVETLRSPGLYHYYVQAVYEEGESLPGATYSVEFPFIDNPVEPPLPIFTKLHSNYPNPFNPTTNIRFDLANGGMTELRVFNLRGQLVNTLWKGDLGVGRHSFIWDGRDSSSRRVASGIYFYQLISDRFTETRRMLLLK